jgi:hypothetical protein
MTTCMLSHFSGCVDVLMRYMLTPEAESTHVRRVVTLGIRWSLKLVQPLLVRAFRVERGRTLLALKGGFRRPAALAANVTARAVQLAEIQLANPGKSPVGAGECLYASPGPKRALRSRPVGGSHHPARCPSEADEGGY